jgi:hypothetical protein
VTVQRYRRKPVREVREEQCAARYNPGLLLDDLRAVAREADGELAEAAFPSGHVLVARFTRTYDDHPPRIEYVTVEAGHYLAYDPAEGFLYEADEADWRQFYDLVPDGEQP